MKRFFRSTRGRLAMTHAAMLMVALLIADIAVYATVLKVEQTAADGVLRAQAATITAGIEEIKGQVVFGGGDLPTETQQGVVVEAAIVTLTGLQTQTPTQPLRAADLAGVVAGARRAGGPVMFDVTDAHGAPRRVFAEPLMAGQAQSPVLVVSRSTGELLASMDTVGLLLVLLSALVVVTGTALAYRQTGRALEPVRSIASMARSISEHDLHRRVDIVVPPDELGELVATFNGMLARLDDSFEGLRRFTADASHELRTPLALMRTELDGALARQRDPAENRRVLLEMQREVVRMSRLVDRLLMLARADAGSLRPALAPVDVADTLYEAAARWRPEAQRKTVRIEVQAPDSGRVQADPDLLRRVLDNLLDNAVRHTPNRGAIHLTAERDDGGWRLDVHDGGPGVPVQARGQLFQRFARVDGARDRSNGGAGLGLALSRAIAEAHGGSLVLVENGSPGALFRLRLPANS
ncbi:MAG: ATP-binding protein [Candidatus Dormibacteraeota bacterium]|nr:ATP-binding protein [Candidatus Dormibacteraeota bacterium]